MKKVSAIQFKEDDEDWLKSLYKRTKSTGFRDYYQLMINNAIAQEKQQKDQKVNLDKKKEVKNETVKTGALKNIGLLEEAASKDETQEFFEQLLDAFVQINFYNLLHWQVFQPGRETN